MKKIIAIVGARPQFIKHSPICLAFKNFFDLKTIHTGQHYDERMSAVFFKEMNIPKPDYQLTIGSGSHGIQTAAMLIEIEPILEKEKPDWVLLYGDTNSTLSGALAAAKLHIPIAHIEAGLRSFNKKMPEEINRVVTDYCSTVLFCPSQTAVNNLEREGITKNVFITGDVMLDMVELSKPHLKRLLPHPYYFATLHRPYNTDDPARLSAILKTFNKLPHPVMLATHPRTKHFIEQYGMKTIDFQNIIFAEPQGYLESLSLQFYSEYVLTDSGGIQKEAYFLRKPCITIRSETEWVETLENNWNQLVWDDIDSILDKINIKLGKYIEQIYGKGDAAIEIRDILLKINA